jgi:hypothetical protein
MQKAQIELIKRSTGIHPDHEELTFRDLLIEAARQLRTVCFTLIALWLLGII